MNEIIRLKPVIKNYDWGNKFLISNLLGDGESSVPCAELWMGSHRDGSATLLETHESFRNFLDENPDFAGCNADDFPFLFKVLAIDKPLSIQCHPDKEQAEKGFREKNINYTDPNQKAELFYALSDCTLLCGFRKTPEKNKESDELFEYLKSLYPEDEAVNYAYKLNIVHLEEGEAIFLKPCIPHAYIKGFGIELMNNSNNVLRLGLTSKHIDKKELYKIMIQKPYNVDLLGSYEDCGGEHFYTQAGFKLTVMENGFFYGKEDGVRIIICTEGKAVLNDDFVLSKGEVCAVKRCFDLQADVDGRLFSATAI